MLVTWKRLKILKPSANNSSLVPSVRLNRREIRRSTYQILGCLKKLRGRRPKRVAPPEPFGPLPGVEPLKPNDAGEMFPEMLPVRRCPEKALKIGAMVQPFRTALPALLSLPLKKSVL